MVDIVNSFKQKDRAGSSLLLGFGRTVNPLRLLGQIRCNKTKLITSFRPLISETVENLITSSKVSRVYCKGGSIGGKSHEGSGKNYLRYVWGKMQ